MCGVSASGKTAVAARLAALTERAHLSADVIHKELLGLAPTERVPPELHTDELALRTYAELGRRAAAAGKAIVDATFSRRRYRSTFHEAYGSERAALFVECRAPPEVLRARAIERLGEDTRVSDATPIIVARQLVEFEPLDEVPPDQHLVVDTRAQILETIAAVLGRLENRF